MVDTLTECLSFGNGIAAQALSANMLVKAGTVAKTIDICGAGDSCVGAVLADWASGATLSYARRGPGQCYVIGTAALAIGDLVKPAAAGQAQPEASAGAKTANTVGVAKSVCSGAGKLFLMEWL